MWAKTVYEEDGRLREVVAIFLGKNAQCSSRRKRMEVEKMTIQSRFSDAHVRADDLLGRVGGDDFLKVVGFNLGGKWVRLRCAG